MPALTRHYPAEILPEVGAPAGAEHFAAAGTQLQTLMDHADMDSGDVLGIAAAHLMHIPLQICVPDPPAPDSAPQTDSSAHCVDEPYFDLMFSSSPQVHAVDPVRPPSNPPDEVIQRLSPESWKSFMHLWFHI